MKKIFTFFIFVLITQVDAVAQQFPLLSQYMFNGLVLNPAYAGSKPFTSASIDIRKQWAGFEGSPTTQAATIHGLTDSKKVGLGFMISNDKLVFKTRLMFLEVTLFTCQAEDTSFH